jgi:hypothetical protein
MKFKKGNNYGIGRPKGSANKNTEALRGYFYDLLEENREQLKEDLYSLDPKDRVNALIQLSKLVLPQLKQVDLTAKVVNSKNERVFLTVKQITLLFTKVTTHYKK